MDELGFVGQGGIELQGVDDGVGDLSVGCYLDGLQETIIVGALVGQGEDVTGDVEQGRALPLGRVELQGVDGSVGDGAGVGYGEGLEPSVVTVALVGDGVDIARDVDDVRRFAVDGVELQGIDHGVGDGAAAGGRHVLACAADPALDGQGIGDVQGGVIGDGDGIGRGAGEVVAVGGDAGGRGGAAAH